LKIFTYFLHFISTEFWIVFNSDQHGIATAYADKEDIFIYKLSIAVIGCRK